MTEAKTTEGYPRKPRTLPDGSWFYAESKGICVVIGTQQTIIPWRKVAAALGHHFAAKRAKRRRK